MTLYAADVMDLAKPVETKKRKLAPKKEAVITPPPSETETPVPVPVPKKPRTEKQIAALARAKEARLRKKQEREALQETLQKQVDEEQQKAEALATKKEAAKEKRRLAALRRKEAKKELDDAVAAVQSEKPQSSEHVTVPEIAKPKVKKVRMKRNPEDPPAWFQKYVEGVKREQAQGEKKPVKQIQQEAQEEAKTKWGDGMVRDRLTNEVDAHMSRMYNMIFGR